MSAYDGWQNVDTYSIDYESAEWTRSRKDIRIEELTHQVELMSAEIKSLREGSTMGENWELMEARGADQYSDDLRQSNRDKRISGLEKEIAALARELKEQREELKALREFVTR